MPQYKFFLLELLYGVVEELERHKLLTISTGTLSEVTQATTDVITDGIRIVWLDRAL